MPSRVKGGLNIWKISQAIDGKKYQIFSNILLNLRYSASVDFTGQLFAFRIIAATQIPSYTGMRCYKSVKSIQILYFKVTVY